MRKTKVRELTIRLTEGDRRALAAAAAEEHLPLSTWLRKVGLEAAAERRLAADRRAQLAVLAERLRALPRFERGEE